MLVNDQGGIFGEMSYMGKCSVEMSRGKCLRHSDTTRCDWIKSFIV